MLDYQEHRFAMNAQGDLARDIEHALEADPKRTRAALDGWISRSAEIGPGSIRVEVVDPTGEIELSFLESQWFACRVERGEAQHRHPVRFRLEPGALILRTLPRDALGERVDEI